jgi:hypothetical protein
VKPYLASSLVICSSWTPPVPITGLVPFGAVAARVVRGSRHTMPEQQGSA